MHQRQIHPESGRFMTATSQTVDWFDRRLGPFVHALVGLAFRFRRTTIIAIHVVLALCSNYLAFLLRFDGVVPVDAARAARQTAILLIAVRVLVFLLLGLHNRLWRYTSLRDIARIFITVVAGSAILFAVIHGVIKVAPYPRSIFILDGLILFVLMSGVRLARRMVRETRYAAGATRVLVVGAGDAGEMIVRDMLKNPSYGARPIGFIDDNPSKVGRQIHGLRVLGTRARIARVIDEQKPGEILIAVPSESPASLRKIAASLQPFKIPITTLPSMRDLYMGKVTVNQIRPLSIEDLLARAPVGLNPDPVRALIAGKRVMVTGAGGSIGSELCRQIVSFKPASLALVDRYENSLHFITVALHDKGYGSILASYLADITDRPRLGQVFKQARPDIVFHAAAHKHVPMVEMNPSEGFKNNVMGTRLLAEEAVRSGVERFVLISTDKAVNPTNVMGATKRVAECCIQAMAADQGPAGRTAFCAVRFGNVLGSNGSVVPRFLDQIKAGGPVTVTHPQIKRFFMLIPEAVQLVMHAASKAETGSVYVLEMGEQINVAEMARNLIRLSGFVPDEEISLEFTGLRPGEKLFEELVGIDEAAEPSGIEGIHRVRANGTIDHEVLRPLVEKAIDAAIAGEDARVVSLLKTIIPTYQTPVLDGNEASSRMVVAAP